MKTYTVLRTYGDHERETQVFSSVPADVDFRQLVINQISLDIDDEHYTMGFVDPDTERDIVSGFFRMYDGDILVETIDAGQFWDTDDIGPVNYGYFCPGGQGEACVHYRPPWRDVPDETIDDPNYRPF